MEIFRKFSNSVKIRSYHFSSDFIFFRKQWFLFGEKPEVVGDPFTKDIYKRELTKDGYIRFYFDIEGMLYDLFKEFEFIAIKITKF